MSKFIAVFLLGLFRTPWRRDRDIVDGDAPAGIDDSQLASTTVNEPAPRGPLRHPRLTNVGGGR
ncbi:MAG TPA: hypothetical protein VFU97_06480, partial [Xanthobacteraceae bacterium]|nr:hypothetical protein [Xanthobacteraceae bacterium]